MFHFSCNYESVYNNFAQKRKGRKKRHDDGYIPFEKIKGYCYPFSLHYALLTIERCFLEL